MPTSEQPIHAVKKSDTAEIRVSRQLWKGRTVIDVRLWYMPKGMADFVPSRKGFTVDVAKLPELIDALQVAV